LTVTDLGMAWLIVEVAHVPPLGSHLGRCLRGSYMMFFSIGKLETLGEHDVRRRVFLVGKMMPRLLAVPEHIIRSWDSRSCCVI